MKRLLIQIRFSSRLPTHGANETFKKISKIFGGGSRQPQSAYWEGKIEEGETWTFISTNLNFDVNIIKEHFVINNVKNVQVNSHLTNSHSFEVNDV